MNLLHVDMPLDYYGYVYEITNILDGRNYIGQHRLLDVNEPFSRYMGSGSRLMKDQEKLGIENFRKSILEFHKNALDLQIAEARLIQQNKVAGKAEYNILVQPIPLAECQECSEFVGNYSVLEKHLRKTHGIFAHEECAVCGEVFQTSNGLRNHTRMKHPELLGIEPSICELCQFSTYLNAGLTIHMSLIHSEAVYDCKTCDKSFKHESRLTKHSAKCFINVCSDCSKNIDKDAVRCHPCNMKMRLLSESYPTAKDIEDSLMRNFGNFTKAAKEFSMSCNGLRNRCKKYGMVASAKEWRLLVK